MHPNAPPPPTGYRAEAFAEDLLLEAEAALPQAGRRFEALLSLLPLCTALLGFAFALI